MIQRKTISGMLAVAALAALSFWAGRKSTDLDRLPTPGLDTRLDYALRDFEMQFYDLLGEPSAHLSAPRLANDAETGIARVARPIVDITHAGSLWRVVADSAVISADRERVVLSGNVRLNRAGDPGTPPLDISTSELSLEITPRIASSSQRVYIADGSDTMEAEGFSVDMTANRFRLFRQVKITYAPDPQIR
ncbi:MAG: LPS export ABC transporter periplasmic protein LptC [Xanthomonadales bacterium]|nr:LPS export ABC transporter periplasmic protein LptC [Xanthomonadales bacterium]